MGAALENAVFADDHDFIRAADGGQAVGDHQRRAPLGETIKRGLNLALGGGIQRAGRLVQNEHTRVFQEDTGDGDALLLAAGEHDAALADEPGVLSRVSGLFSRRGFNIESLAVGPTQDSEVSRITIVVLGDDAHIEQLVQQLYKLICVQKVQVLSNRNDVERQLLLVKVAASVKEREGLMRLVDIFKAKVLDVTKSSMILEITGDNDKITAMMRLLEDYGILELVRTGVVALERGDDVMSSDIFE